MSHSQVKSQINQLIVRKTRFSLFVPSLASCIFLSWLCFPESTGKTVLNNRDFPILIPQSHFHYPLIFPVWTTLTRCNKSDR